MLGSALDVLSGSTGGQLDGGTTAHRAVGCKSGPQDRGSSKEMDLQVPLIKMI